jgi:secondary thiamine-phosphate synthase enzyme
MIIQKKLYITSKGYTDIIDITPSLRKYVQEAGVDNGNILVFVPGSTGSLTTIEYEPGLLKDLPELLERIIPMHTSYHHDNTWHDGNGYAHLRAALMGSSITIPFADKELQLGTWQQVVFIDFDNRSRQRNLHVQIYGE